MTDIKEKIVYKSVKDLVPYEYNPREHNTEIEYLKNSIKEFGFRNPILVDGKMVIIAGHGRKMAAEQLGIEKVPVIICDDLSDEQVKALRAVDNKISDNSGWNWDNLNKELEELKDLGWNMEQFSFEDMSKFDEPADDPLENAGDDIDFVTEVDGKEADPEYKILVTLATKSAQDELFEYLLRNGYVCQVLN